MLNVFDFVTDAEIGDLPDDPNEAFMRFVQHAQRSLATKVADIDGSRDEGWSIIQDARHSFVNVVVSAAKRYGIKPFVSMDMPRVAAFGNDEYRQFQADLDHYMTQLVLDSHIRGRQESVAIPSKVRDRIRQHLYALKEAVDNSSLPDAKKDALLRRLTEFESQLENRRLGLAAFALVVLQIVAIPGGVWQSAEVTNKLFNNLMQAVAEAKDAEDGVRRLGPTAPPMALLAPRQEAPKPNPPDLDDEIPF